MDIDQRVEGFNKQARWNGPRVLCSGRNRQCPELALKLGSITVCFLQADRINAGSMKRKTRCHMCSKQLFNRSPLFRRQEVRAKVRRTDRIRLFEHEGPTLVESRHGHEESESKEQCEQAEQGGLQYVDMSHSRLIAQIGAAYPKSKCKLGRSEESSKEYKK